MTFNQWFRRWVVWDISDRSMKGPSLAAPMLAITTRSNELNEKNPQPNSALVSNCWAELITTQDNQLKQGGSKSSGISHRLIVHLQVSQHATCRANLIREVAFADADKVFINRLPSLKDAVVTMFSINWMHFIPAALRYLWRVSFDVKHHITQGKLPRNN